MTNTYLISVKPQWAFLFFDNESPKTVELRKGNFGKLIKAGDRLLIYATVPAGKIIGTVTVRNRQEMKIEDLRAATENFAKVSEEDFASYYAGKETGIAVWVEQPIKFDRPIPLEELKAAGLQPPQQATKLTAEQIALLEPPASLSNESGEPIELDYLEIDINAAAGIASAQIEELEADKPNFPKKEYESRLWECKERIAAWSYIREAIASAKRLAGGIDWLEEKIKSELAIAQSAPATKDIKKRVKNYVAVNVLKYASEAISRARIPFSPEYKAIVGREHPRIEDEPGYAPTFNVGRVVETLNHNTRELQFCASSILKGSKTLGTLLLVGIQSQEIAVCIETYYFCETEWIANCRVITSNNPKCEKGDKFYIRARELFSNFGEKLWKPLKLVYTRPYWLGMVLTKQELKSKVKIPRVPTSATPFCTEVTAPDGSIWQAVQEGLNSKSPIKWICEVLPDGTSRSPRIQQAS